MSLEIAELREYKKLNENGSNVDNYFAKMLRNQETTLSFLKVIHDRVGSDWEPVENGSFAKVPAIEAENSQQTEGSVEKNTEKSTEGVSEVEEEKMKSMVVST